MDIYFQPSKWPRWLRRVSMLTFPVFWPAWFAVFITSILLTFFAMCVCAPFVWVLMSLDDWRDYWSRP